MKRKTRSMMAAAAGFSLLFQSVAMAAGPVAVKVNHGYDDATWSKLTDGTLEYDEIPLLVHEFNRNIKDGWEALEDARDDLNKNVEELQSHQRKMKDLKEAAEAEGNYEEIVNYATQEAILKQVTASMRKQGLGAVNSRKTRNGIQQGEDSLVKVSQSLMLQYDMLQKQLGTLRQLEVLYGEQYKLAVNKKANSMATEKDVLAAQINQLSAQQNILSLESGLMQLKPTLFSLTGWAADENPQIASIPPVDQSFLGSMNLQEDTKKAIGNNTTLQEQRHSEGGKTNGGTAARLAMIEEGEEKLTIEMKRLYDEVFTREAAYEAALVGYEGSQKSRDGSDRMFQLGLLSKSDYLGAQISYYQKKAAFESSDLAFRQAIESYQWAIKGLSEIET